MLTLTTVFKPYSFSSRAWSREALKFHTFHRPTEGMKFQGFAALSPTGKTALIQYIGQQQLAYERLESMP